MDGSRSAGSLTMLMASLALAGLAGCAANTRANLTNAADNLEYNANALVRDAGDQVARSDHALARDAHEFRELVDQGGSDHAMREAFDRVSRSYHAVRDEVAQSENPRARSDLASLTDSYRALQHELGIYPGRDEYAQVPRG